jgi:hypothetical protein
MSTKTKIAALAALATVIAAPAFAANGAEAKYRATSQMHLRRLSREFGQAYGYVPSEASQYQSNSQGNQSYPNPDRGPYPTPCGSCRL